MDEYILFDKKEKDVKKEINRRKIRLLLAPVIHVIKGIAFSICHSVKLIFEKIYNINLFILSNYNINKILFFRFFIYSCLISNSSLSVRSFQ